MTPVAAQPHETGGVFLQWLRPKLTRQTIGLMAGLSAWPAWASAVNTATAAPATVLPASPAMGGLQVLLGLTVVLALLMGGVWLLKRFAPASRAGGAPIRVVGGVSVGGRERVMVVEVADQWIVVGVAPGRVNALSTLPRQETLPAMPGVASPVGAAGDRNFSAWLKQSLEKRNGR